MACIWGKGKNFDIKSKQADGLLTGGKLGRIGYHNWDVSLEQTTRKDFIIVRRISVIANRKLSLTVLFLAYMDHDLLSHYRLSFS